jgi:hypothetical protein
MVLGCAIVMATGVACAGPEKAVVDRYFGALAAGDNQTLTSFAAVRLEEPVEAWSIVSASEETSAPATLPELGKKHADLVAELDANKKAANAYALERLDEVDEVRELAKEEKPIPRRLQEIADTWEQYNKTDHELKVSVAEAKEAMENEATICRLSVAEMEGFESAAGEVLTKVVQLMLTIDGQQKPYEMTLRRYVLDQPEGAPRPTSRWVVYDLKPTG